MRKISLFITLLLAGLTGYSQQEYSDQYLGWLKLVKPTDPVKSTRYDHRTFTAAQLSTCNLFISWIQASYLPKGGLGEGRKYANEKLNPYNQYTRSIHDYYGATLPTYLYLKKKPGGGWTPENNLGLFLRITANGLTGDHVDLISSTEQYYFYIPRLETNNTFDQAASQFMNFQGHPSLTQFIHFYQPKSTRYLAQYTVLLSPGNEVPWIQITKGEFLDQLGKSIERAHQEKTEKIREDFNEQRKLRFLQDEDSLYKKRIRILAQQKEKYKNRLAEKATIYTEQPSVHLENTPDVFEGNDGSNSRIPVYKYDPSRLQKIKDGKPQWITITWGGSEMSNESFINLHSAMLNSLNYTFIYNYFFDAEKTKGLSYKPLRSPVVKEEVVVVRESSASTQKKSTPGTILYEDFSNTLPGKTPVNWKSTNNFNGEKVKTEQRNNINWATFNGQQLEYSPTLLFPENFTFSCSIAVPKGYTWGAKRLVIRFGNGKESFEVSMRPGYDGRPGFLYAGKGDSGSSVLIPGSMDKASEIEMPGFSNNEPFNQIGLEVSKKGKSLELRINGRQVFTQQEAFISPGQKLQGLSFSHSRSDAEQEKYYISNLLIKK